MEEAAAVRRAALEAVDDVEPDRLVERIGQRLDDGSMAPGVLTLLSADAVEKGVPTEAVADRAAGVQLIYEGLRLTRTLAHSQPWVTDGVGDWQSPADERLATNGSGKSARAAAADIDILVADILVARGFYVLARTEAADTAVSVVRSFGRDQTIHRETDDPSLDDNLEADVFELAVVAGTTAAGGDATASLREFATGLATGEGSLPPADTLFPEAIGERLDGLTGTDASAGSARTSADH
jgi:hypothetical protein